MSRSWMWRPATQELPPGDIGEIIIKGPQVMKGYWNLPTETANALRIGPDGQPGWFYTGDIGFMDDGWLLSHGRPQEGHDHRRRL